MFHLIRVWQVLHQLREGVKVLQKWFVVLESIDS
jgi:hypothetical protein